MAKKSNQVGKISHYYPKIKVGIIKLSANVNQGDRLGFGGKGKSEDFEFEQVVDEMQYDHKEIKSGKKGREVGVKMKQKVRKGVPVYLAE